MEESPSTVDKYYTWCILDEVLRAECASFREGSLRFVIPKHRDHSRRERRASPEDHT